MKKARFYKSTGTKIILIMVFVSVLLSSCKSVPYNKIDELVFQGLYEEGLQEIENAKEKKIYKKKDGLLYYLEAGMLAHYAKQYEKSNELLKSAEEKIAASVTKSVSREVGSYLVNDRVKEYGGEDYENLYVNIFSALNYYVLAMEEDAMVEIRRLQNKLRVLKNKYLSEIKDVQKKILNKSKDVAYDNENIKKTKFSNSALGQYLGMLFYRSRIQRDDARINYQNIHLAFATHKDIYHFPVPTSIEEDLYVPPKKARLNCVSFYGLSPVKKEEVLRIPIPPANWLKIALPVMHTRPSQVAQVKLVFTEKKPFVEKSEKKKTKNNESQEKTLIEKKLKKNSSKENSNNSEKNIIDFEPLEDISAVAIETFKSRSTVIYLKTILRSLSKTITAAVLTQQSMEQQNESYELQNNGGNKQPKDTNDTQTETIEKGDLPKNKMSQEHNYNTTQNKSQDKALIFGLFGFLTQMYAEFSERADVRTSRYFPSMATIAGVTLEPGMYSFSIEYYSNDQKLLFSEHFKDVPVKSRQLNLCESYYLR